MYQLAGGFSPANCFFRRRIASLSGINPKGIGIGEHELFRQQIDPIFWYK